MSDHKKIHINDLRQDEANINKGTAKGKEVLGRSLSRFGAGRSVLLDKNNRIIAGNKTVLSAISAGIKEVLVVDSDGSSLVAVKRQDIDIDTRRGRELALADNMSSALGFDIDYNKIAILEKDYEVHPEIWDIPLLFKDEEGLSTVSEKNETAKTEVIRIGAKRFVITPEELEGLNKSLGEYRKEHESENGFLGHLLNKYDERVNADSEA